MLELLCFFSAIFVHFGLISSQPTYVNESCLGGNYTNNSAFAANVNILLSSLSSNASLNDGFYNTTTGQSPDLVYGLLLCRGDVTTEICKNCSKMVSEDIKRRCPNNTEAILWYDMCMIRYSNRYFFSLNHERPAICMSNTKNLDNPDQFDQIVGDLMYRIMEEAKSNVTGKKFATGETEVTGFQKIYGLVQCTPDISQLECGICLGRSINEIANCSSKMLGGRYLKPSCNFRYEVFPFYELKAASPALPPPTNTTNGNKSSNSSIIGAIIVVSIVVTIIFLSVIYIYLRRRRKLKEKSNNAEEMNTVESLLFDFRTIRAATDDFSDANKLGQGGFGVVYKGRLLDGQEIAVKRLSRNNEQNQEEFKNEVVLVAKLQHRNLVRLLGFCLEGEEKLLVYEFMLNRSLDHFIFDPINRAQLDWETRFKIIEGIARGLLYLHEDSQLRIIHRDLKAGNILLDRVMNPKISDFGTARLFVMDQSRADTNRVVGTYGYMAPEYVTHGRFSVKSDVFSFGVLLLEIVSGQKNNRFHVSEYAENLLSYAWRLWKEGRGLELIDPAFKDSCSRSEMIRCIHIGLLCVQENVSNRPIMRSVVLMLSSYSFTLPVPSAPAFFVHSRMETDAPSREYNSRSIETEGSVNEVSVTELYPR